MFEPDVHRAIEIHKKVIEKTEGKKLNFIRGKDGWNLLDSALNSAFASFGEKEVYPTPFKKALRVLVGIIKNHPFVDGNKRTAFVVFKEILREHRFTVTGYSKEDVVKLLEQLAAFQKDIEELIEIAEKFFKPYLKEIM